jgi:hypothetical protein
MRSYEPIEAALENTLRELGPAEVLRALAQRLAGLPGS